MTCGCFPDTKAELSGYYRDCITHKKPKIMTVSLRKSLQTSDPEN